MSEGTRTRLEERWNRAATQYCAGSEFIDYPERVFESIADRIRMSSELAAKKATLKFKVDRDELLEALKGLVAARDSVTLGLEKELFAKYLPMARAAIARAEGGQS